MILLLGVVHVPECFNSDAAPVKHTVRNAYFYFQSAGTYEIKFLALTSSYQSLQNRQHCYTLPQQSPAKVFQGSRFGQVRRPLSSNQY